MMPLNIPSSATEAEHPTWSDWSKRAYVSDLAAIKAWNRATGKRYVGTEGGMIYRADDNGKPTGAHICQGWLNLVEKRLRGTVQIKRDDDDPSRYRYRTRVRVRNTDQRA